MSRRLQSIPKQTTNHKYDAKPRTKDSSNGTIKKKLAKELPEETNWLMQD